MRNAFEKKRSVTALVAPGGDADRTTRAITLSAEEPPLRSSSSVRRRAAPRAARVPRD
jgi:hypothetical protein